MTTKATVSARKNIKNSKAKLKRRLIRLSNFYGKQSTLVAEPFREHYQDKAELACTWLALV